LLFLVFLLSWLGDFKNHYSHLRAWSALALARLARLGPGARAAFERRVCGNNS
jgi:hypothetical protein